MAFDFEAYDTKRAEDLQPDRPLPPGTWKLKGTGANRKEGGTSAAGKEYPSSVSLGWVAVEPQEDVDTDAIAENKWQGAKGWSRHFVETEGDYAKVMVLMSNIGVDISGKSPGEVLEAFGKVKPLVFAEVGVRTYTNRDGELVPENTFKNIVAA